MLVWWAGWWVRGRGGEQMERQAKGWCPEEGMRSMVLVTMVTMARRGR